MYFLRIDEQNNAIGFVSDEIHKILSTDISITPEEYQQYFEGEAAGKNFRPKRNRPEKGSLFDMIEEYTPEIPDLPPSKTEMLEEQVEMLDGALNEVLFTILPEIQGGEI